MATTIGGTGERNPLHLIPTTQMMGIKAILHGHRPIFPVIAKHAADVDIYLEIVARYSENDEPRGLCLSAETVLLISELGGAVDIDVVPLVREGA